MATATLNWTANPPSEGVTNYRIYRALGTANETPLVTLGNVTTHTDSTIPDTFNGIARYTITALDGSANESAHSAPGTKVFDAIPPSAPVGLVVA